MNISFDRYFDWLLGWEGTKYENVPGDRGGPTKFGIDQRSHPAVNIRGLTRDQAKGIYREDYWAPIRGPELPWPLDVVMMDIAVNNGRTRAVQWLQQQVGTVCDGVFGPRTMAALRKERATAIAKRLLDRRERFYNDIAVGTQRKFLKGWLNRNDSLRAYIA